MELILLMNKCVLMTVAAGFIAAAPLNLNAAEAQEHAPHGLRVVNRRLVFFAHLVLVSSLDRGLVGHDGGVPAATV